MCVISLIFLGITLSIRIYVDKEFKAYTAAHQPVIDLGEAGSPLILNYEPEKTGDEASELEGFQREISELKRLTRSVNNDFTVDRRETEKQLAAFWNELLMRIVRALALHLDAKSWEQLKESENAFLQLRVLECRKAALSAGSGFSENIAYLDCYIRMSEDRCLALLKEYEGYLAN